MCCAVCANEWCSDSPLTPAQVKRLIKDEREAGNPVAALVHALALERNAITLALSNWAEDEEGDDDAKTRAATLVSAPMRSRDIAALCVLSEVPGSRKDRVAVSWACSKGLPHMHDWSELHLGGRAVACMPQWQIR